MNLTARLKRAIQAEWRRMGRKQQWILLGLVAVFAILAILFGVGIVRALIRYLQTDSWHELPYEAYGEAVSAQRLHGSVDPAQLRERLQRCARNRTDVVGQDWSALQRAFLTVHSPDAPPRRSSPGPNLQVAIYAVEPLQDQLEFVWDWILFSSPHSEVSTPRHEEPHQEPPLVVPNASMHFSPAGPVLRFSDYGVEYVQVASLADAMTYSAAIFVGADYSFTPPPKHNFRYGLIMLSGEDCINERQPDERLKFGLLPYGDCALVDDQRFFHLPLGPQTPKRNGFPLTSATPVPAMAERPYLLNLLATYTPQKPTRMQAWMAAQALCRQSGQSCVLGTSWQDLLMAKLRLRALMGRPESRYYGVLTSSRFTLCPSGQNPEQYRIWEALLAGSIPVVEDRTAAWARDDYLSPAFGPKFRCTPQDSHAVLHRFDAPVLYVEDWRTDLPRLLRSMDDEELEAWQARGQLWLHNLRTHYRLLLLRESILRLA